MGMKYDEGLAAATIGICLKMMMEHMTDKQIKRALQPWRVDGYLEILRKKQPEEPEALDK